MDRDTCGWVGRIHSPPCPRPWGGGGGVALWGTGSGDIPNRRGPKEAKGERMAPMR